MSSQSKKCLNCERPLHGDFCSHCGQSAAIHRFSLKHIFKQDFLRVIFYFHGSFFYTIKELFTRPGHSVREYINGKRVRHLNYFTLLVVVILLFSFVEHLTPFRYADLGGDDNKEVLKTFDDILQNHPKYIIIGVIPFYALCTFMIFRQANHNYAEHFVLNTFKASAILIFNIVFITVSSFIKDLSTVRIMDQVLVFLTLGYTSWLYYQYFYVFYTNKFLLLCRTLLSVVVPSLVLTLLVIFALMKWNS